MMLGQIGGMGVASDLARGRGGVSGCDAESDELDVDSG